MSIYLSIASLQKANINKTLKIIVPIKYYFILGKLNNNMMENIVHLTIQSVTETKDIYILLSRTCMPCWLYINIRLKLKHI